VTRSIIRYTAPYCLSGHPALALPCGFQANLAPISFEFVGHGFQEATLVRIADAYQSATA